MEKILIVVGVLAFVLSANIIHACSVATLDWYSRNIMFTLSNPDYTGAAAVDIENILNGAPGNPSFVTDVFTTVTFTSPRTVKTLHVESKFANKASVRIAGTTVTELVTNPTSNEALTFDLESFGAVLSLEIIPDLVYSSEVKFRRLSMDVCTVSCSTTTRLNYGDVNNGFTVTNPDYPNLPNAEAILEGSPIIGFVTDDVTTVTFSSPIYVKTLYFKSKFQSSSTIKIKGTTITTPITVTSSSTVLTYDLLNFDLITSIEFIPSLVVSSEVKYKDLYMEVCTGPCSIISASDVTISPSSYQNILNPGAKTWIVSSAPAVLTLNTPTNIAGMSIGAKKFDQYLRIVGKNSQGSVVFTQDFLATNKKFQTFSSTFADLQLDVKTIELIAVSNIGKVKEIQIEMCPFSQ